MRRQSKSDIPQVLEDNHEAWSAAYSADPQDTVKRMKYRHPEIKRQLREETANKCVYCESKVGHNTPGDVEHKIPSSVRPELHFDWGNLTIACSECNRRKSNYFSQDVPFLDPYSDDVEIRVLHHGPVVGWAPGDVPAEITVKTLSLHDWAREQLLQRKIEKIAEVNEILSRREETDSPALRELLTEQLVAMQGRDAEYSAMVKAICERVELPNRERVADPTGPN